MNYKSFQTQIVKNLLSFEPVRYWVDSNGIYLFTVDGYVGVVLNEKQIAFNVGLCKKVDDVSEPTLPHEKDEQLIITSKCRDINNGYARLLKGVDAHAWVNEKFLNMFGDCLCYGYALDQRVLVKDYSGNLLGAILPIRIRDKDE